MPREPLAPRPIHGEYRKRGDKVDSALRRYADFRQVVVEIGEKTPSMYTAP